MKTAISLNDQLYRRAEEFAQQRSLTRSELYANALDEYLQRHASQDITRQLDELYATEDSGLSPELVELGFVALRRG